MGYLRRLVPLLSIRFLALQIVTHLLLVPFVQSYEASLSMLDLDIPVSNILVDHMTDTFEADGIYKVLTHLIYSSKIHAPFPGTFHCGQKTTGS